ncbi:AAA family ATPase [Stagnihabitans tardus]|uniref:AAA family ATPase n=1 Tax=Stagnihabitans tardus TaxID=2699202 RepID=A0AAE4YBF2_9RHOB|nr:AAA family ATPase [Stagnihabitans tardus]NBZ89607.1 AAA family ATPase [Stagnihabitans tardus]
MPRRPHRTALPAPFLQRISLREKLTSRDYPFNLPWLQDPDFELTFQSPVTILTGENGSGKSTLVEALAALSGYDEAGGGKGYRPVDHSRALDTSGAALADALRAAWLPKITKGWFFRAETFFSVARYLDAVDSPSADFLSHSHGEGFTRFFTERMADQGIYFLDEPESALSPRRQLDLLRLLARISESASAQVIMATHSPLLMAVPGAQVLELTRHGIAQTDYRQTRHFKLYRDFTADPQSFVTEVLEDTTDSQF